MPQLASVYDIVTDPSFMNLAFLIGTLAIGKLLSDRYPSSLRVRAAILGLYCLFTAIVSIKYNSILAYTALALSLLCGISIIAFQCNLLPNIVIKPSHTSVAKSSSKKKTSKQ